MDEQAKEDLELIQRHIDKHGGFIEEGHIILTYEGVARNFWRNADREPVEITRAARWIRRLERKLR